MIGIYARVSTIKQENNYSVQEQKDRGIRFSTDLGEEYKVFSEVKSGGSLNRPVLDEMFKDIEAGLVNKVWVIEITRISRSLEDGTVIKRFFQKNKVDFYIDGQKTDFGSLTDRFMYNINLSVAELEKERIAERFNRGKLKKREQGKLNIVSKIYGYRSIGYDQETGKKLWESVPEEIETIKYIYSQYLSGVSIRQITKILNEGLYPKRTAKAWFATKVTRILKQIIYTGYIYKTPKGEEIVKSTIYEPFIDIKDFQKIKKEWKHTATNKAGMKYYSIRQVSGIIECSECGADAYYRISNTAGWTIRDDGKREYNRAYYSVSRHNKGCGASHVYMNYYNMNYLFDILYFQTFSDRRELMKLHEIYDKQITKQKQELNRNTKRYQERLKKLDAEMKRLIKAVKSGTFEFSDIDVEVSSIKQEKKEISELMVNLNKTLYQNESMYEFIVLEFGETSILKYIYGSESQKRNILLRVIKSAVLKDRTVTVEFITGIKYIFTITQYKFKSADILIIRNKKERGHILIDFETNEVSSTESEIDLEAKRNILNWIDEVQKAKEEGSSLKPLTY